MDQYRRALDVPQEPMPKAGAIMGTGDQPGHVCQDEHLVASFGDTQIRAQCRERVIPDLRVRRARRRQQARLTRVRLTDQCRLGDGFQFELECPLLARLALLRDARRSLRACREVGIAESTSAATGNHNAIARPHQVSVEAVLAGNTRTRRDAQLQVDAGFAVLPRAAAWRAAVGFEVALLREVQEGRYA
jgi:hypothetical protein